MSDHSLGGKNTEAHDDIGRGVQPQADRGGGKRSRGFTSQEGKTESKESQTINRSIVRVCRKEKKRKRRGGEGGRGEKRESGKKKREEKKKRRGKYGWMRRK